MDDGWVRCEFILRVVSFNHEIQNTCNDLVWSNTILKNSWIKLPQHCWCFLLTIIKFTGLVRLEQVILIKKQTFQCFFHLRSSSETLLRHDISLHKCQVLPDCFIVKVCWRLANFKQQSIADTFLHLKCHKSWLLASNCTVFFSPQVWKRSYQLHMTHRFLPP